MGIESVLQTASRADYSFKNIPVIDVEGLESEDLVVRQQLARDIRNACINIGFFYVKNHGIPEKSSFGAVNAGKKFFALPEEIKQKYNLRKSPNYTGYTANFDENNDPAGRGDLHEAFDVGPDKSYSHKQSEIPANPWPNTEVPEFKDCALSFYNAAAEFGKKLFPIFALALGVPENFFDDKTKEDAIVMRVIRYPPQTGPHDDRVIGIGAHSDFEVFTLLWQEPGIESLQVMDANKEWINATPIPGTLVVNVGDQLSRCANDVFKSTVHRAVNRSGVERHSMPVFFNFDYNVKLEAIPSCVSAEHPPKYEVITAGEYVKSRMDTIYNYK
ncbi:2OG-Fe oxygenase [Fomitiporia mediterranea MF3/22]|uniref:2OG-Fe oxygenase n=1 Tax=Fomitiporia mediterranea (strain MF3/22) TaxID=694068 RepID=UPI0004408C6C|nr:2OG-Fe oxygenase [Fomitiporia mediterranea MF3/22]EJC98442.1 2OG-Fe oxygenase [Fomitiporia mediterranea MF3/22]